MSLDRYRTAIVTGASRGIGAAVVRELTIGGLDVYAVARSTEDLTELSAGDTPKALPEKTIAFIQNKDGE